MSAADVLPLVVAAVLVGVLVALYVVARFTVVVTECPRCGAEFRDSYTGAAHRCVGGRP